MKLKFEFVYDTEDGSWFFNDLQGDNQAIENGAELEHSGSSYLRVKVGGRQIGTVGCHIEHIKGETIEDHDKRREGVSPCTISMYYPIPDEVKATFK